jgi:hypothetical protein
MSNTWKVSLATVLVVAVALVGVSTVFADDTPPPPYDRGPFGPGYQHGPGMGYGGGILSEYADIMHKAVSDFLGINESELEAAMEEGETPFSLAVDSDADLEKLRDVMEEARADMIEAALADGAIDDELADWLQNRAGGPGMFGGFGEGHCDGSGPMMGAGPGGWGRGR